MSANNTHQATIGSSRAERIKQLIKENLRRLFRRPQAVVHAERGCYVEGERVCLLVDTEPGEVPGTFHVGLTVFPVTQEFGELAGIGIVLRGREEARPNVYPLRRGVTNHHGSLTWKDLAVGGYRFALADSVVVSNGPLPLSKAAGMATGVPPLAFEEYVSADGSLTCILSETRERALVLDFETAFPAEWDGLDELWVEYVIAEQGTDKVATIERSGQDIALAGCVALRHETGGHYTAQVTLGYNVVLPSADCLRAYIVPPPTPAQGEADAKQQGQRE